MKKIKFFSLFFVWCLSFALFVALAVPAAASDSLLSSQDSSFDGPGPSLSSYSAVIMDQKTGEALFTQRADARVYPADTAKLMTALLAVEAIEQGEVSLSGETQVSAAAVADLGTEATRLLTEGETITLNDLLYCAILASADDAANAIAEYVAGDQAAFVEKMNERAERLGCTATQFTNPSGLYAEENYSTAGDMARIALEATRHELLWRICTAKTYDVPETDRSGARSLKTTNPLLVSDGVYGSGYRYQRATGIKTGYNAYAGYCIVSSAEDEESGIQLLAAVYGGQRGDAGVSAFRDAVTLFDWVFSNYSYQEVLSPTKNIASVDVNLGSDADYVNLRPAAAITLLLPNQYDAKAFDLEMTVYSLQQGKIVTAPVTAGEVLGEVSVIKGGQNYGTVKLVAATGVDLSRSRYIVSHIQETLHSPAFLLLAGEAARLMTELNRHWHSSFLGLSVAGELFELLRQEPDVANPVHLNRNALDGTLPTVSFDHVSFKYPNGTQALEDISLDIPAGATVAIVGQSGAGKSTVINLLQRFYDCSSGRMNSFMLD